MHRNRMTTDLRRWSDMVTQQMFSEGRAMLAEVEVPASVFEEAARRLLDNIDWSGGDGETVLHMIGIDVNNLDEPVDLKNPEIEERLLDWAIDRVRDAYQDIDYRFSGDTIRIYREITAPAKWKPDPTQHPGIYWSWDEGAAEAHWGSFSNGQVKWLLTAEVTAAQIDWVSTLAANGAPSYEDEREITLIEGTPVHLISCQRRAR